MLGDSIMENRAVAYRFLMEGVQEVLGVDTLSNITADLCLDGRQGPAAASGLLYRLVETYGACGGRGLAQRIGRAMFRYGLKDLGEQVGFREISFRILPSPRRVESGLRILASLLGDITGEPVQIADQETNWTLTMACCPGEDSHSAATLRGDIVTGLVQEFASWAGGGRYYPVAETACRAAGAPACVFQVDKKSLD